MKSLLTTILLFVLAAGGVSASGRDTLAVYEAKAIATAGSGEFAPMYMTANRFGMITSANNILLSAKVERSLDLTRRFAWSFGAQVAGGYSSNVTYTRYNAGTRAWNPNKMHPARVFLQQLYAGAKWRSLFLNVGMKEYGSPMLNDNLSSGDLIHSPNARPIPQARVGFVDFQPVPFTKGFLQVGGEFAYGKFADADWWSNHSDNYNTMTVSGIWYVYRRLYFRSDPSRRFSMIIGAQAAGQFGGHTVYLHKGEVERTNNRGVKFVDFIKMIVPHEKGAEDFVQGNTLGSWDLKGTYLFKNGTELKAYMQWPWEDGSGMAKLNGFDGLYGVELSMPGDAPVLKGAVVEYLDLTNQSGPIHWAPADFPGTLITSQATGADDYYNNYYYGAYANYGMIMGTPMVLAPIYNLDGYNSIIANRVRGFHVAAEGFITPAVLWRAKIGYRKAFGNGYDPLLSPLHSTSALLSVKWQPISLKGFDIGADIAIDRGKLPANSFGAMLTVSYSGIIPLKK
jgi:hypothetical protein